MLLLWIENLAKCLIADNIVCSIGEFSQLVNFSFASELFNSAILIELFLGKHASQFPL